MRTKRIIPAAVAALLAIAAVGYADAIPAVGSVSGTVKTSDGKPAVGVTIKVTAVTKGKRPDDPAPKAADPAKPDKSKSPSKVIATATTDDKGMFKIESVPTGTYVVTANLKDVGRAKVNVTISAGHDFPVNMQLVKATKAAS